MRYRYLRFPEGRTRAATFSYDDGVSSDKRLAELFTAAGLKATFNLNSANIPRDSSVKSHMNVHDIKKYIIDAGHELAVHGKEHIAPAAVRPIDSIKEVLFGRLELEEIFDMTIRGMAYPDSGIRNEANGNSAEIVKRQLSELGIAYARTLGGDNNDFKLPADFYAWMPSAHHNNPKIFEYIDEFLALEVGKSYFARGYSRLLYIWGHSYEFDRDKNWDRIEQIAEKLSGNPDIWYATNIEIHDYIKAYEALIISADGRRIYNPTLIKVWFSVDGVTYSVAPGENIRITQA